MLYVISYDCLASKSIFNDITIIEFKTKVTERESESGIAESESEFILNLLKLELEKEYSLIF